MCVCVRSALLPAHTHTHVGAITRQRRCRNYFEYSRALACIGLTCVAVRGSIGRNFLIGFGTGGNYARLKRFTGLTRCDSGADSMAWERCAINAALVGSRTEGVTKTFEWLREKSRGASLGLE